MTSLTVADRNLTCDVVRYKFPLVAPLQSYCRCNWPFPYSLIYIWMHETMAPEYIKTQLNCCLESLKQEGLLCFCWPPVSKGQKKKKDQVFSVVPFNAINSNNTLSPARKFNNMSCEFPSREWGERRKM